MVLRLRARAAGSAALCSIPRRTVWFEGSMDVNRGRAGGRVRSETRTKSSSGDLFDDHHNAGTGINALKVQVVVLRKHTRALLV
jgi:hypothetical protein